jgi:hypothetical protein
MPAGFFTRQRCHTKENILDTYVYPNIIFRFAYHLTQADLHILMETLTDYAKQHLPTLQQWMKENPNSSINAYYSEYGAKITPTTSTAPSAPVAPPATFNSGYSHYTESHTTINNTVITAPKKSVALALVLTLFFGPLGLFYASFWGALIMIALDAAAFVLLTTSAFSIGSLGGSFAAIGLIGGLVWLVLVQWPACMLWALIACIRHNRRNQELLLLL